MFIKIFKVISYIILIMSIMQLKNNNDGLFMYYSIGGFSFLAILEIIETISESKYYKDFKTYNERRK